MKPYKPSNIATVNGIQLLLLSSILGAILGGAVLGFISQFVYLIVLFPVVLGGAVGTASTIGVKLGKVRNPLIAGAVALLAGIISYGSLNYIQYLDSRQSFARDIVNINPENEQNSEKMFDEFLQQEVNNSGFIGYVQFSAKQGIQITRSGRSGGFKLDQTFTLVYWLIELAIIESLAVWLAVSAAQEPFCEEAQDWYGEENFLANAELKDQDQLIKALNSDNYAHAATMLNFLIGLDEPRLDLAVKLSPDPNQDCYLILKKITFNAKKQMSTDRLLEGLITAKQQTELVEFVDTREIGIEDFMAAEQTDSPENQA